MPIKVIEKFDVPYMRILDEKGVVDKKLEPELSEEQLVKIYRDMYLAREGDQRMLKMQRQGRVGTFGPCSGQEACVVPSATALGENDWFVGAFREMGGRMVRGEPISNCYLFHNGFEEGNVLPETASKRMLPINIIVGSQTLHAAGIGYAMKYRKEKAAVIVYMGDGATSEGDFHEAMNFAAVWKAPVIFLCQNNQWAISIPREKQTASSTLAQKAIAYGMPGIQVDGNDALAVYKATKDALDRAYAGEGPTFIEAVTYRLMMHTTADDPTRYRTEEEVEEWRKIEPLIRFRKYLEAKGYWDDKKQAAFEEEIKNEVDQAVKDFESQSGFKPDAPFDHVYGTTHEEIEEQRQEFLASLKEDSSNA
jgi:pyruvate dehydrogenase E1 component alpha subunit